MFSQRKGENLIDENIALKYEKTDSPDNRFGVIGSKGRQAFAAFVEIDDTDRIQKYFHYIKFKSFNLNSSSRCTDNRSRKNTRPFGCF